MAWRCRRIPGLFKPVQALSAKCVCIPRRPLLPNRLFRVQRYAHASPLTPLHRLPLDLPSYAAVVQMPSVSSASSAKGEETGKAKDKGAGAIADAATGSATSAATACDPPLVPYFEDSSVATENAHVRADRADAVSALQELHEGLSFVDHWGVLAVAPHASGLCMKAATGPGVVIVPMHVRSHPASLAPAAPPQDASY